MNVLLVVPWDQRVGGVAAVVGNLARHLERDGHQVVFFHPGESEHCEARSTAWGFSGYERNLRGPWSRDDPVKCVLAFIAYLPLTLYQLAMIIRLHRIQVVNIHYPVEFFIYFGVLRWFLPIRLVVSIHGADVSGTSRMARRPSWALRLIVACADAVVAPSKAFLLEVLEIFPRAARRAHAILNGIDLQEFATPESDDSRGGSSPYILCIAAHNEKKALDVLLRAFAAVSRSRNDVRLLLVGGGPLSSELEAQAGSLNLSGRVRFLGRLGRAEVAQLLHGCALFVLPSRNEPFGLVVAEALACRKPVIASNVGGIAEIIEDGRSGLLVPPDDPSALANALEILLNNPELGRQLAQEGHRRVLREFSHERMGSEYQRLYAALLPVALRLP